MSRPSSSQAPTVGLFATCLIDLFRPSAGLAALELLRRAGCSVDVPLNQTCCGQPAYNNGDRKNTMALARNVIDAFEGFDYVVVPSGSCAGMIKRHYPGVFKEDPAWGKRAEALAHKTYELTAFLVDVMQVNESPARFDGVVTVHDSCSALRELQVKEQPRRLLKGVAGASLAEMPGSDVCCGFGGTFCVKYPEISTKMAADKVQSIMATGADMVVSTDLGCLLNLAGRLTRSGATVTVRHIAEILAGTHERTAPIGRPEAERTGSSS